MNSSEYPPVKKYPPHLCSGPQDIDRQSAANCKGKSQQHKQYPYKMDNNNQISKDFI